MQAVEIASDEIERTVIGKVLTTPDALGRALAAGLAPSHFFDDGCRDLFVAVLEAERDSRPYSAAAISLALPGLSKLIADARREARPSLDIEPFVREMLDQAWRRRALDWLTSVAHDLTGRRAWDKIAPLRSRIEEGLNALCNEDVGGKRGPVHVAPAIDELLASIEKQIDVRSKGGMPGVRTGLAELDEAMGGGLPRGAMSTFAARTGLGKTTLAINLLRTAAFDGLTGLYVSVEMKNRELVRKLLSRDAVVSASNMRIGDLNNDELDRISKSAQDLHDKLIWFDDSTRARIEEVQRSIRLLKRRGPLDLVIVDYIQQFRCAGKFSTAFERVSEVSNQLKQMALDEDLVIVALAQLNREAAKGGLPDVHQIKDSGAIEQDSDVICLLYDDGGHPAIRVGKNRHGLDGFSFGVTVDLAVNLIGNLDPRGAK